MNTTTDSTTPTPSMSASDLQAGVAALGRGFNEAMLDATRDLYRPSIRQHLSPAGAMDLDVAYGTAERHRLDVYHGPGKGLPVIVFVHGGGYVAGNKQSDEVFYGNIGHYFAGAGFVAVIMNYRLAPDHAWPSGHADVRGAMDWIAANIGQYGGDAGKIFLMGQSAGASHAAAYLFDPDTCEHASRCVTAALLLNGVYRLEAPLSPNAVAYFGSDPAQYQRRAPMSHVGNSRVPLMLCVSEFDPPAFVSHGFALAEAVTLRDGRSPVFYWMAGHNHVSNVHSLGSAQDEVGEHLLAFLRKHL